MRIAMVAPLAEAVPPILYGGTERVVSALTEELVRRGHDMTLFASGDSLTAANLVVCSPASLRQQTRIHDFTPHTMVQVDEVYSHAADFDIIHSHIDWHALPLARRSATPTVSTMHGRMDWPEIMAAYRHFAEQPLISISDSQRAPMPDANWVATVSNGLDLSRFHCKTTVGDYLVFLGRISPEKRPDRAIEIAARVGMPLVIAAKVDRADQEYYDEIIAPMIRDCPLVQFIGEIDEPRKDELLGGAYALLFPIDWPEPFGLTMIEAMATGTPVLAMRSGSVPEVMSDGVTGFICNSVDEMVERLPSIAAVDRHACRQHVEERFSAEVMADGYERAYELVIEGSRGALPRIEGNGLGKHLDLDLAAR